MHNITLGVVTLGGRVKGFTGVGYLYPSNLVVTSIGGEVGFGVVGIFLGVGLGVTI